MPQDVISYLKAHKGMNLEKLIPELRLVDDSNRFDSGRYDIVAVHNSQDSFYGIKALRPDLSRKDFKKLSEDAEWFRKFKGIPVMLMPDPQEGCPDISWNEDMIIRKYYSRDGNDFVFYDNPVVRQLAVIEQQGHRLVKTVTNPQVIDQILKAFEKKSEFVKIARVAYNAYIKASR